MKTTKIYYERKKSIAPYENHTVGIEVQLADAEEDTAAAALNFAKGFVARELGDAGNEPRLARPGRSGGGEHDAPRQSNSADPSGPGGAVPEAEKPSTAHLERFMERMYELGDAVRVPRPIVDRAIKSALANINLKSLEQAPAEWLIRVRSAAEVGGFDFKTGEIAAMDVVA